MKKTKKSLAIILTLSVFLSLFAGLGSFSVSAAGTEASGRRELTSDGVYWYSDTKTTGYTSGSGTAEDPYIITTDAQLRNAARGTGNKYYYKLGNDIEINDTSSDDWYNGSNLKNWIKGNGNGFNTYSNDRNSFEMGGNLFRSEFDGDGHTISGLYINYEGTGFMSTRPYGAWALFPAVLSATFKNLKLKDVYIKSDVSSSNTEYHGYGALIGVAHGGTGVTVTNVEIENVKFDVKRPGLSSATDSRVCIGGIIGYAVDSIAATDCIVKNVSANIGNYYFTTRMYGYAGSILGFVAMNKMHSLTNVISVGAMNPFSVQAANAAITIQSGNYASNMPIRIGSSATNVWAIGAGSILAGSDINRAADLNEFLSNDLDTFYSNIATNGSTNWEAKAEKLVPRLKSFVDVVSTCDFSNYATREVYVNSPNAESNWTIEQESENKYLKCNLSLATTQEKRAFTITPTSKPDGRYLWEEDGPLNPGTVYKLTFKAKANAAFTMKYTILTGYSFASTGCNRYKHINEDYIYDNECQRTAELTTDWQSFTMYFTAESPDYPNINDKGGKNRPIFQIADKRALSYTLYFDDIELSVVEDAVSFMNYDDSHYSEPFVGGNGTYIAAPSDPARAGYKFDGWYTDSNFTTPLNNTSRVSKSVKTVYAKWDIPCVSHSLSLANRIDINFYLDLDGLTASQKSNMYMTFDIADYDGDIDSSYYDSEEVNGSGDYKFTISLSQSLLPNTITPTLHYSGGESLIGTAFSIEDYVDYISSNSGSFSSDEVTYAGKLDTYITLIENRDLKVDGIVDICDFVQADIYSNAGDETYDDAYLTGLGQIILEVYDYLDGAAVPVALPEVLF